MKTFSQFSAFALLVLVVMMMMVMMAQASDLFGETNVDPDIAPVEYNGKLYYIHKDNFTDFELSRNNCAADGGMLVEINDSPEYDFIEDYLVFLKNQGKYYANVIGGKYQPEDSQWVLPSTGAPLPVFRPASIIDEFTPEQYPGWCLAFLILKYYRVSTMVMYPLPCHLDNPENSRPIMRYLCEKIYAPYSPTQLPNADPNIPAIEYQDKIYYIHKKLFTDYQANLEDCKADGGVMAEINDYNEFLVLQKYMNSIFRFASSDDDFSGGKNISNGWVLPSTNQRLPYVTCLILSGDKGWNMASTYCNTYALPQYRFLCEKPKDS